MNIPTPLEASRTPQPRRRWLRVSLRGLMVLVVLIGGVAGWVAHTIRTQRQAIAAVKAVGGTVRFDFQKEQVGVSRGRPVYRQEPAAPGWLRRWLGDELFQSVRSVYFPDAVSPDVLAAVGRFDSLEGFTLNGATGVGDGFRQFQGLTRLAQVWIAGPGITDAMLGDLAQIPSIRELTIGRSLNMRRTSQMDVTSPATDEGFARLAALPNLRSLDIEYCPSLTDAGAAWLVERLPPLQFFALDGGPKSLTATLPALARRHPDLESLTLDRTGVSDDDLKAVEALPTLRHIGLQSTRITSKGVMHLRSLKLLSGILINNTDVTDEGLQILGELPALEGLYCNKTKVSDAGIAALAKLPRLRELSMGLNTITDAAMPSVAQITSLERLDLGFLPELTDAGLLLLQALKKLKQLDVRETRVTPEGIATLRQAIPSLTRVTTKSARPAAPPASVAK